MSGNPELLLYVTDGKFGAMMQVHIQNDGPVTIPLESPDNLPVCIFESPTHLAVSPDKAFNIVNILIDHLITG